LGGVYVGTTAVTFIEASPAAGVSLGVAPAAGDASLKVTAVVPTYTPPKQNARQTSRVSTTIVANGLALQKTQNIASSSTPVLNNNLSIRGNSANW